MNNLLDGKWDAETYIRDMSKELELRRAHFIKTREEYRINRRHLKAEVKRAERFLNGGKR